MLLLTKHLGKVESVLSLLLKAHFFSEFLNHSTNFCQTFKGSVFIWKNMSFGISSGLEFWACHLLIVYP